MFNNQLHHIYGSKQIILIGDNGANMPDTIKDLRAQRGESYWAEKPKDWFKKPTDYLTELKYVKKQKIEMNCFYVRNGGKAKEHFDLFASETGGSS